MDPKMVSGLSEFDEVVIAISKNIRKKHITHFMSISDFFYRLSF